MRRLRLRLLGGFELDADGSIPRLPRKAKALLAYLALAPGVPHSRDKLAGLLWTPDRDRQARQNLRQTLADLRRLVPESAAAVSSMQDAVMLAADALEVDALEFERLIAFGTPAAIERAVALYRGDLLEGFAARATGFDDWSASLANRTREQALGAMARLLDHWLLAGQIDAGVQLALRLLALDPLRESAHRALMQLYARQGRRSSALRQFQICRQILRNELGTEPEPQTVELHQSLAGPREPAMPIQQDAADTLASADARAGDFADSGTLLRPEADGELAPVTVLAVRIARFSALAQGLDPEALRNYLNRYYESIDGEVVRHGGVVAKHANELVLAVFGLSGSRGGGNDAERAARVAAALHDAASHEGWAPSAGGRGMPISIGMASGRVLTDQLGSAQYREPAVIGPCVTVATELSQVATPGTTLATEEAYQGIVGRFLASALPSADRSAGRIWMLGRERDPDRGPLIGRQRERQMFESALEACRNSGAGQCFLVRGEAGIGKSRLVEEIASQALAQGFQRHEAWVLDFGAEPGSDAVRTLSRSLARVASEPSSATAAIGHSGATTGSDALGAPMIASGPLALDQQPFLFDLLGLRLPPALEAAYHAMEPSVREEGRQAVLARLVVASATSRPLLLVVEDIHWADPTTLMRLARVAAVVEDCPAVLVLTVRSEDRALDPAWPVALHGTALTTVDLGPLKEAEAVELASFWLATDRAAGAGHEAALRRCVARAGGNPFFLEQLLHATDSHDATIPHSVQGLVHARLERLPADDRRAVRAAAVLGQQFSVAALRAVSGLADYGVEPLLQQRLVKPRGGQYLFTHALIAESVYGELIKSERERLHRAAAAWCQGRDPVLAAEHLVRAGDPGAASACLEAAAVLAAAYRNDEALRMARLGREIDAGSAVGHELACLEAELLQEAGEIQGSIDAYQRVADTATSASERCRAWVGIASGLRVQDRYALALEALDRAERTASRADERARIHLHRGDVMVPLGRTADCLEAHSQALRFARAAASPLLEARALSGLGDAHYLQGRMVTARDHFGRCLALCRAHGFGRIEVGSQAMHGATRFYAGEVMAAIEDARGAAEFAQRIANRRAQAIARNVLSYLLCYRGDHEGAHREAELGLALAAGLQSKRFEIKSRLNLGLALIGIGRRQEAERALDAALDLAATSGILFWSPWALAARALVSVDPVQRDEALASGEAMLARAAVGHNVLHFHQLAIEVALAAGDWSRARHYAALLHEHTRIEPLIWSDHYVARARALAAAGELPRDGALQIGGQTSAEVRSALWSLLRQARAAGLAQSVPALEQALERLFPGLPAGDAP